jgi:hypothetical protein
MPARPPAKQWFRFCYQQPLRSREAPMPHKTRDGDAALFLAPALQARGYTYGGPLFNYPRRAEGQRKLPPLIDVEHPRLRSTDLLVLTTRPPMDDLDDGNRRPPMRSYTTLEDKVFTALRRHFQHCSRSQVIVTKDHAQRFPRVALRYNREFRLYRTRREREENVTVTWAYMAYSRHAWPGGPGLLTAFGMSGMQTLAWTQRLHRQFPHLVATEPFVMAEMIWRARPDLPWSTAFADEWDVQLLTDPATTAGRTVRRRSRR